jgi:uncharacterized protein
MTNVEDTSDLITSIDELEAVYGPINPNSLAKQTDWITPEYRRLIEASPFLALATSGEGGLDCSPRGDNGQAVTVVDEKTVHLADRRGNNRLDSLRNIVTDPRVGLLFLIPGVSECMRINGRAALSTAPALLERHTHEGKAPRSVIVVTVEAVYFQCARAIKRSELWNPEIQVDRASLPTPGQIMSAVTNGTFDGDAYDAELPARQTDTLY